MRPFRKLALAAGATLGVVLLLLVLLPYAFRDQLAARARDAVARAVDAQVAWSGVRLALLRDFPNVTLRLHDVTVVGNAPFAGDTLVAARELRLVLDLGSVIGHLRRGDALVVREIAVHEPRVRLTVLADGRRNWDIVRPRDGPAASDTASSFALSLRALVIDAARLRFDDRQSRLIVDADSVTLRLAGDLTRDAVDLATQLRAEALSVRFAGVPYLAGARLALDTDVGVDRRTGRITFHRDELRLNELVLAFDGSVTAGDERTQLDLSFAAPSTDFASLLSLVPALYGPDFARLCTSGSMAVRGRVRGAYGAHDFPALAIRAQVRDGAFQHPDLPLPARDIRLDLAIDNPGGDVDATVVTLDRLHLALGGRPVDARLVLRTPVSDPAVELRLRGTVRLEDVPRTIALDTGTTLAGLVHADVELRTRQSLVDAGRWDEVAAAGRIAVSRLAVRAAALRHPVAVDTAQLRVTPRRVEVVTLVARAGASDVRATGALDNVLGFVMRGDALRGEAVVASRRVDLNEWRSNDALQTIPVPANVDLTLRVTADTVRYATLTLGDARGALQLRDARATLDDVRVAMLGGQVTASGWYDTAHPAQPRFDLAVAVDSVDVRAAAAALTTVQRLAPIARYASGRASADLKLAGTLGPDLAPVLPALAGSGTVRTAQLAIDGFPPLVRLADALRVEALRTPTLRAIEASVHIADGRVHLRPFELRAGDVAMTVAGSNGLDQSLDYALGLAVPTALLGTEGARAITALAARAGRVGLDLGDGQVVSVGVSVTGTVTDPTVRPTFGGTAGSIRDGVRQAVQGAVEQRVAEVEQRVDSVADEARRRARAEAERIVADADARAAAIRGEADSLAARLRVEADARATALVARATNPVARVAAQAGADRARREADAQAARLVREAGEQADSLVAEARRRADAIAAPP